MYLTIAHVYSLMKSVPIQSFSKNQNTCGHK